MTLIGLIQRFPSKSSNQPVTRDEALEEGGIVINDDNFSDALERRYDVRGLKNQHIEIKNDGANGVTYSIGKASREVDDVSTLVDADFTDLLTDEDIVAGSSDVRDIIDISPESTAIRLQFKRTTASQDTTISGVSSFN